MKYISLNKIKIVLLRSRYISVGRGVLSSFKIKHLKYHIKILTWIFLSLHLEQSSTNNIYSCCMRKIKKAGGFNLKFRNYIKCSEVDYFI